MKEKQSSASAIAKAMGRVSAVGQWAKTEPPRPLRTCITSLNRAFRIGGIPTGQIGICHGPSQGGKTILGTEILRAAVATGGFGLLCDTERRSNDIDWFAALHGQQVVESIYRWPEGDEPSTYQSCVEKVEKARAIFRKLKTDKDLPAEAVFAFVVDSIDRLVPEEELEDFQKNGIKGRGYPLRAMMHGLWMDKLVNTLRKDEVAVFVVREGTKLDAGQYEAKWKMRGGKALQFDSGWIVRVGSGDEGTSSNKSVQVAMPGSDTKVKIGERHDLWIRKSSTSNRLGQRGCFFIGAGISEEMPMGFDRAREIREEALLRGVLVKRGSEWFVEAAAAMAMGIDEVTGVRGKDAIPAWLMGDPMRVDTFANYLDVTSVGWAEQDNESVVVRDEETGATGATAEAGE